MRRPGPRGGRPPAKKGPRRGGAAAGGRPPIGSKPRPQSPGRPESAWRRAGPPRQEREKTLGPHGRRAEREKPWLHHDRQPDRERVLPREPRRPDPEAGGALAVGFQAVRTVLEQHPERVEKLLVGRDNADHRTRQLVAMARENRVPFQQVPGQALDRLSPGVRHQGVAAKLSGTPLQGEESLIEHLSERAVVLILDGIEDPRNVGAILRSAAAFGAEGVFIPAHHACGVSPGAVKTAAGGLDLVPVGRAGNLNRLLERLEGEGFTLAALVPGGALPPWNCDLTGKLAIVAGGEEKGIRPSLLGRCRVRIGIPIRAAVGSLNVSVAVGIVLAEASRQRSVAENPPPFSANP